MLHRLNWFGTVACSPNYLSIDFLRKSSAWYAEILLRCIQIGIKVIWHIRYDQTKSNWKFERPIGLNDLENFSHSDPCWLNSYWVCCIFHLLLIYHQQITFEIATLIQVVAEKYATSGFLYPTRGLHPYSRG